MKNAWIIVVALVVGAGLFWLGRISHGGDGSTAKITSSAPPSPLPGSTGTPANSTSTNATAQHPPPALMSPGDWQKLRSTRDQVLQSNPDLQAEYKQILKKMDAQQASLDDAMIKADPAVKPVVAKLVELRQKNGAPALASPNGTTKPAPNTPAVKLTTEDMQELRTARTAAIQANPALLTGNKAIGDQMRDFQIKLDAAMIKIDPTIAPVIAQFQNDRKPPASPAPTTPSPVK